MYKYYPLTNSTYEYYDTFNYFGETYNANAVVKLKDNVKVGQPVKPHMVQLVKHIVINGTEDVWKYALWYQTGFIAHYCAHEPPEQMIEEIILNGQEHFDEELSSCYTPKEKLEEYNGAVLKAFMLYIAFMIFIMIFRDFIVGWVFATACFVMWKKDLKKKLNHYKYGFDFNKKIYELNIPV